MTAESTLTPVSSGANPEVPMNEGLTASNAAYLFNSKTSSGLTWNYYGDRWSGFLIAAGTHALTDDLTNYFVVDRSDGSKNVTTTDTNWNDTANYARIYKITTAAGVVTGYEDHRFGESGLFGGSGAVGDFTGAASSTDNAIVRFDGATGKVAQNSGVTIDDSNNITLPDSELIRAKLKDFSLTRNDIGTVSSGTGTVDLENGNVQKLTAGGNFTLAFSNWSASGSRGEVQLDAVNFGAHTITWPTINWPKLDGSGYWTTITDYFTDTGKSLQSAGTNQFTFWTDDAGTTVYGVML